MQRCTPSSNATVRANLTKLRIRIQADPTPVYAYANHGRWVADCQTCNGAELVIEGQGFLCGTCGRNSPAIWPDETEQIESVLGPRPVVNQNWTPGETVAFLEAENIEHGLAVIL